jgi:aminoglycoside 6-adenylyltransferase
MRSSNEMYSLIISTALADDRIRAVLLNGSRANNGARADSFQDFDIVYVVTELKSFLFDHSWIDVFGERIILQMPDSMTIGNENAKEKYSFSYLMLFKDGNRIDLTLFPVDKLKSHYKSDSLTKVLLDKDGIFNTAQGPDLKDYLIHRPTQNEFTDCCNEFWWVSTYVAKGLHRHEMTYAKEMLDHYVRAMFMKMVEWYIGFEKEFSVSFGKAGRHMKEHISQNLYHRILSTYADGKEENTWTALFNMTSVFSELAAIIVTKSGFAYNLADEQNVMVYLEKVKNLRQE